MRLTAQEWLGQVGRILRGGAGGPLGAARSHQAEDGIQSSTVLDYETVAYQLNDDSPEQQWIQVVPTGYYDTIWITQLVTRVRTTQQPYPHPVIVIPGRLREAPGSYNWTELWSQYGGSQETGFEALLQQHTPLLYYPRPVNPGIPVQGGFTAIAEIQLTNQPFAILFDDAEVIWESLVGSTPLLNWVCRITLQTLRN